MIAWLVWIGLGVFWFTFAIMCAAFILEYFHNRSLRKHQKRMEDDYAQELIWQNARDEELVSEQRQTLLEETDREYMDVMRAEEIIRELEGDTCEHKTLEDKAGRT